MSLTDQLFATRILIFFSFICFLLIIYFILFNIQTNTITISFPSETLFKQLSSQYSICTSQFINQTFLSSLSDVNMSNYYILDYRIIAASHFQILASLCRIIKQIISDSLDEFYSKQIITHQVISYETFHAQIDHFQ
ncbi:hypothetical protein I4U23_022787 [Adineta vaga]|nr:hypothetical protein I4U23_022787 [Adineta vaga]